MKKSDRIKLRRGLFIVLIFLLLVALPVSIYRLFDSYSQDSFTVDSAKEHITVYTGGEIEILREASCRVREKAGKVHGVRLPVPPGSASELTAISKNIKKLSVVKDISGESIYAVFDKDYLAGEEFSFSLSYKINSCCNADIVNNKCMFTYEAGNFSKAYVNKLEVYWTSNMAVQGNHDFEENGSLEWNRSPGRDPVTVRVVYPLNLFNYNVFMSAVGDYTKEAVIPVYIITACICVTVSIIIILLFILRFRQRKTYINGRGIFADDASHSRALTDEKSRGE